MFLHESKKVFSEVVSGASDAIGMPLDIVEKDYYVTMILKLLAQQYDNVVFKGGTSLSKAHHVLSRFSEDIDITFSEHIGASRRKKLKNDVVARISTTLKIPISNWDELQSDRDVNTYYFDYKALYPVSDKLPARVKLETALGSYAFPTVERQINSYVYKFLSDSNEKSLIEMYGLTPFTMNVQSVERTFIDKIFALCDYYLDKKCNRLSRHLYDLYKLYPLISFDSQFRELFKTVRLHRVSMNNCPSAKADVNLQTTIHEICESDYYKGDYESITSYFVTEPVSYQDAKARFLVISERI